MPLVLELAALNHGALPCSSSESLLCFGFHQIFSDGGGQNPYRPRPHDHTLHEFTAHTSTLR